MWFFSSRKARPRTSDRPYQRPYRPRFEGLEERSLMSAGALDPTFGAGAGYVTTALSSGSGNSAKQVLVQPSGNIVVAGSSNDAFGAVTYNPDGSLDTAFGSGGIVRQLFAGAAGGSLGSAALEPMGTTGDSKILLAGRDFGQAGMALMRLNANGTLDTTFGSNGQVVTPFQSNVVFTNGVAVTSSGQILAAGFDGGHTVLLARYNPNGSLDPMFGSGGKATTVLTSSGTNFHASVLALALQPDGKFVVVGQQYWTLSTGGIFHEGMLLRYNANGSLDTTFGNGGVVTTVIPFGSSPNTTYAAVAIYPNTGAANDGKIIAVGSVSSVSGVTLSRAWAAVRYNANGSLDTTFGNGAGSVVIGNPQGVPAGQYAWAVAIESDGKPIIAGGIGGPSQVARLNVDGSLDATFGNGGLVTTAIGAGGPFYGGAIQPDGKFLAAGSAGFGSQQDWTLARYLPSEPQIGSFTASANPVTSGSNVTLTASNITDGNAGSSITQVTFYYYDSHGVKQVLGYGTQSNPGVWTLTFTVGLAPGSYTLYAQATDSYGVVGDPLALALQVL
jgi:uncharacterized delta-60 repeat protein